MDYVIFSIDNAHDLHTKAKFLRKMDTHRSMKEMWGSMILSMGSYEGVLEDSYILDSTDFDKFVRKSGFVDNQETFLYVAADSRMACWLKTPSGDTVGFSRLVTVTQPNPWENWTYRPDLNLYWVAERDM